eukprot:9355266-Lingulodinium_polyedra.AAC.1
MLAAPSAAQECAVERTGGWPVALAIVAGTFLAAIFFGLGVLFGLLAVKPTEPRQHYRQLPGGEQCTARAPARGRS